MAQKENVIILGPPWVGKTHLAIAIGIGACQSGKGVYFITADGLITALKKGYAEGRLEKRFRVYLRPELLIIDELGYLPMDKLGVHLFFQLIARRYERGSIIITSNRGYGGSFWRCCGRSSDPGSIITSLDYDKHKRRELSVTREALSAQAGTNRTIDKGSNRGYKERMKVGKTGEFYIGDDTIKVFERITVKGISRSKNIAAFAMKITAQTQVIMLFIVRNDLSYQ